MGRVLLQFCASVLSFSQLLGCGNEPEKVSPPLDWEGRQSSTLEPPPTHGPFAALPPFVDGGARCSVQEEPKYGRSNQHGGEEEPSLGRGLKKKRRKIPAVNRLGGVLRVAETTPPVEGQPEDSAKARCSGPELWCRFFGPSRKDQENHRLREEMAESRRSNQARMKEMERRLLDAQRAVQREREKTEARLNRLGRRDGVFLTNDDSFSLASPQRLIFAIENEAPLRHEQVRPHELLNFFHFETPPILDTESFSVQADLAKHPVRKTDVTLGFSVRGKRVSRASRRNLHLSYVIDRSSSMAAANRLPLVKKALLRSLDEMKAGDIIHLTLFDSVTCPLAQNFVVGRDSMPRLKALISGIAARRGSNLRDGLGQGYESANRLYRPGQENRVLLFTDEDEVASIGEEELIALSARQYDARRVRLSAIGLGQGVSDRLLERLTEAGKGASLSLSSEEMVERFFGEEFSSLVETIATDVHFRLELPEALSLRAFYGEEASRRKERVKSVHYFSGTGQMYLANLVQRAPLQAEDEVRLTVDFNDPETGAPREERFSWSATQLGVSSGGLGDELRPNLEKARMVATFGYQLKYMARTYEELFRSRERSASIMGVATEKERRRDRMQTEAETHCARVQGRLDAFSASLQGEPEARRLVGLWRKYCRRYLKDSSPPSTEGARGGWKVVEATERERLTEELLRVNEFPLQAEDL